MLKEFLSHQVVKIKLRLVISYLLLNGLRQVVMIKLRLITNYLLLKDFLSYQMVKIKLRLHFSYLLQICLLIDYLDQFKLRLLISLYFKSLEHLLHQTIPKFFQHNFQMSKDIHYMSHIFQHDQLPKNFLENYCIFIRNVILHLCECTL